MEAGSREADHEARNEYLSEIHQTWQEFRDTVEGVQGAYEDSLESCSAVFERVRAEAATEHATAIEAAWATYKQEVNQAGSKNRRDVIIDARGKYREAASAIHADYDSKVSVARDSYSASLEEARVTYDSAVDGALATYRNAVKNVDHFMEATDDESLDTLEMAGAIAARLSGEKAVPKSDEVSAKDLEAALDAISQDDSLVSS
ncbi:MAG: hypothetical protein ACLPQS_04385 [Acidimicrobiales bacterium]